jgi:hypothetical protein
VSTGRLTWLGGVVSTGAALLGGGGGGVVESVGAGVVGVVFTSTGGVITSGCFVVALLGGFTQMLPHALWLPEVSTAATFTMNDAVWLAQGKLTKSADVSEVEPSARTR